MQIMSLSTVVMVSFLLQHASAQVDIGDQLYRTYTGYTKLPRSKPEAQQMQVQWAKYKAFDANLGEGWAENGKIQEHTPLTIYFGNSGQISGVGVDIWGDIPQELQGTYFIKNDQGRWHISVSFRAAEAIQNGSFSDHRLGDRLVINQGKLNVSLPLREKDAINQRFQKGACFYSMGTHYFQDISTFNAASDMTWQGYNLLPVVPMYHNGLINAFFFATTTRQQTMFPPSSNEWEPIPLPNFAMCQNFCNSDCTWHDTSLWSTFHVYLRDYTQATCNNNCQMNCCK